MKHYHSKIHHRQSLRLAGYDYAKEGSYFIIFVVPKDHPYLGRLRKKVKWF